MTNYHIICHIIYGIISDNGDCSASMYWCTNADLVNKLLDRGEFSMNE